jgi:hypothetical protein
VWQNVKYSEVISHIPLSKFRLFFPQNTIIFAFIPAVLWLQKIITTGRAGGLIKP